MTDDEKKVEEYPGCGPVMWTLATRRRNFGKLSIFLICLGMTIHAALCYAGFVRQVGMGYAIGAAISGFPSVALMSVAIGGRGIHFIRRLGLFLVGAFLWVVAFVFFLQCWPGRSPHRSCGSFTTPK